MQLYIYVLARFNIDMHAYACLKVEGCTCGFSFSNKCQTNSFTGGSAAVPNTSPAQAATISELPQPSAGQGCEVERHYYSDHD